MAYVINLDEYSDIATHWVALYVKTDDITYFDSFGVEHISKEIIKFIGRPSSSALLLKNVMANIFRIRAYDSIMCGYFCIGFINFMHKDKRLTEYTNLFSTNDFKRNDNTTLHYLWAIHIYKMESYCLKCEKHTKKYISTSP